MTNISASILTKNNSRTIRDSLKSLKGVAQDLIIIDDFSTDNTIDIIRKEWPEAVIIKRKLDRFDNQRNHAISMAKNEWILMIDSDEHLDEELRDNIRQIVEEPGIDAYWTDRKNRFFDTYLREDYKDRPILFRKSLRFIYPVHEILEIKKNKQKKMPGNIIHEGWQSISKNMEKMDKYSSLIAQKWIEQNRGYGSIKVFFLAIGLPIRYFFICFFKKGFYRAGLFNGFFYSLFESSWWLAVIFKYRELKDK